MPRLLAAQGAAVFAHILVYVLVAHSGFGIADPQPVKGPVQSEVGHDRGHHRVVGQLAQLLHMAAADIQDMVAGDDLALFVHRQAPIRVAVVGKAHVQAFLHHEALQGLDMSGAHAVVDIEAVWLIAHDVGRGTQCVKNASGDHPGAAIGTVQPHLLALEGEHPQGDEVAHVAVAPRRPIHRAADMVPLRQGKRLPGLAEHFPSR